jgi:diguanylate cyclase
MTQDIGENFRTVNDFANKAESLYQSFFHSNLVAMAAFDQHFRIVEVNEIFSIQLGYSLSDHFDGSWLETQHQLNHDHIKHELRSGTVLQREFTLKHTQGHSILMRITFIPILIDGRFEGFVLIGKDISQKKRDESIHKQLAFYDDMTGLPNRRHFFSTLGHFLREKLASLTSLHIMIVSLDNLKVLNDFGFHVGDSAIKYIGKLLSKMYGDHAYISRINGNEFALIIEDSLRGQIVEQVEELVFTLNHIPQPFLGIEAPLECSVGISQWPDHGNTVEKLIHSAEKAMFTAKDSSAKYCMFTEDMSPLYQQKMESKIKLAIQNKEFYLVFQPIVELETKNIIGYEALVRWLHPEEGVIPPDQFIPFAEQSGIIIEIEKMVLGLACNKLKELDENNPGIYLSVNISALHFHQNLVEHILDAVQKSGVNPKQLKIEITETCSMKDPNNTIIKLNQLKELGIKVSIDDFGAGYSSLQYLGNFPADEIKLDLSFINPITPQKTTIINAVLAIALDYKIEVIAEGIETAEQLTFLTDLGCKYGQGYFLGKPQKM